MSVNTTHNGLTTEQLIQIRGHVNEYLKAIGDKRTYEQAVGLQILTRNLKTLISNSIKEVSFNPMILSPKQVAERWGLKSTQPVIKLFHNGKLKGFRAGEHVIRFRQEDVEAYEQHPCSPTESDSSMYVYTDEHEVRCTNSEENSSKSL